MKLLISIWLIFLSQGASALHRAIVIRHDNLEEANNVKWLLEEVYHIPAEFITLEAHSRPCEKMREFVSWHLCVSTDGDLEEVSADVAFINQTLRIFL